MQSLRDISLMLTAGFMGYIFSIWTVANVGRDLVYARAAQGCSLTLQRVLKQLVAVSI